MGTWNFPMLMEHVGHKLECVTYGNPVQNVALECVTCSEVLFDYDSCSQSENDD